MSQNEVSVFGSKMITLSEKTDTTFSDIPILMIGDNCLVYSPQLLLFKMYVLFLLESPKLNLFNSLCFAVGFLLSGQVGQKLVKLVKSGPSR